MSHAVSADVPVILLVRDTQLVADASAAGRWTWTGVVLGNAAFSVQAMGLTPTVVMAAQVPGGPWISLSEGSWLTVLDGGAGRQHVVIELRDDAGATGSADPPEIRVVARRARDVSASASPSGRLGIETRQP